MPLLSQYQERQLRSVLERQAQGDRYSRMLGFDARHRPVIQAKVRNRIVVYALKRDGMPTAATGEVKNPAVYVDTRNKYKNPHFVICLKMSEGFAGMDTYKTLDEAMQALVKA